MSEPARQAPSPEPGLRTPASTAPLRDWLAAMRAAATETRVAEPRDAEPAPAEPAVEGSAEPQVEPQDVVPQAEAKAEPRMTGWAPRLVTAATPSPAADEDVAEIMAENMMLKARLQLEDERRDELQLLLAQEIRELRAHIAEEVGKMEDMRAERDLWRARCEALAAPLFQAQPR